MKLGIAYINNANKFLFTKLLMEIFTSYLIEFHINHVIAYFYIVFIVISHKYCWRTRTTRTQPSWCI